MGGEQSEVETLGGSEGEHQALVVLIGCRQFFYFKRWGSLLYPCHVGIEVVGVPLTGTAVVGMGSGSYSEIGGSVPVTAVVTGVAAGLTEVGYFVVLKAGLVQVGTRAVIHPGAGVIIGREDTAVIAHLFQGRALLKGEAVGRYVTYVQSGRDFKILLLNIIGLTGKTIHEVNTNIVYSGFATRAYCINCLPGGMTATEETEQVIVEGLDSHADTVDSEFL